MGWAHGRLYKMAITNEGTNTYPVCAYASISTSRASRNNIRTPQWQGLVQPVDCLLHVVSLNTLFNRNQTLIQSSAYQPHPYPFEGLGVHAIRARPGVCIRITTRENLNILRGLRLARPFVFAARPVTSIKCVFNGPLLYTIKEIRSFTQFIACSSNMNTVEVMDISLDPDMITRWAGVADPQCIDVMSDLLYHLNRLSQCMALTLSNTNIFDGLPLKVDKPMWLRRGSKRANIVQSITTSTVQQFALLFNFGLNSSRSPLRFMEVDSSFVFHCLFTHRHHFDSLRTLSLNKLDSTWIRVLGRITFPHLEELSLVCYSLPLKALSGFLVRHRRIRLLKVRGYVSHFKDSSTAPPFFLPNLVTLMSPPRLLSYLLRSSFGSLPSPKLQSITLSLYIQSNVLTGSLPKNDRRLESRLSRIRSLTLNLVILTATRRWLDVEQWPPNPICGHIRRLSIDCWRHSQFLEQEELHCHLPGWLGLFPVLETLDILGCSLGDGSNNSSRQRLFQDIRAKNSRIASIRVDGNLV